MSELGPESRLHKKGIRGVSYRLFHLPGFEPAFTRSKKFRLGMVVLIFCLSFTAIASKLFYLSFYIDSDTKQFQRIASKGGFNRTRADLVDRNGIVLATNLLKPSLFADPSQILDVDEAAYHLASVLDDLDLSKVRRQLSGKGKFVWIKRNLTPRQKQEINELGLPGLYFRNEQQRVYPLGALTAHVVGMTDIDNNGVAGVERSLDAMLNSTSAPVELSIDVRVQHAVQEAVQHAITKFSAVAGAGIVLDAKTSEVLGMVSLPTFDPYDPNKITDDQRFNRATLGMYELGSVFKIFTAAMALESGKVRMSDTFDATNPIKISRFEIRDFEDGEKRPLSLREVIKYSSNIGAAKIATKVGSRNQQAFLKRLGLLNPIAIELPEIGKPQFPETWREINTMTISFGHGLSVSLLHTVNAMASLVNGGKLHHPTLIKREAPSLIKGDTVVSEKTSDQVRDLLRMVVREGTGKNAAVKGYLVGGKTGTAEKAKRNGYAEKSLLSSFIASYPMDDPRYVVMVTVDEPKPIKESYGYATGGWVAAPAVGQIIENTAPILGVEPRGTMASVQETKKAIGQAVSFQVTGDVAQ